VPRGLRWGTTFRRSGHPTTRNDPVAASTASGEGRRTRGRVVGGVYQSMMTSELQFAIRMRRVIGVSRRHH
jgi:hypothetical protein